jgi:hypothetical protein
MAGKFDRERFWQVSMVAGETVEATFLQANWITQAELYAAAAYP